MGLASLHQGLVLNLGSGALPTPVTNMTYFLQVNHIPPHPQTLKPQLKNSCTLEL